jgi:uncharacterized protein (DUF1684 family)
MIRKNLIQRSARLYLALLLVPPLFASCARRSPRSQIDPATYKNEIAQWQEQRLTELKSESGWLTLIGLYWLKEGPNTVGMGSDNDILISPPSSAFTLKEKPPPRLGSFVVTNGVVRFETPLARTFFVDEKPISSVEFKNDAEDKPTVMWFGNVNFQIIKRGDRLGLRIKDSMNPDRVNFKGTEFYAPDLKWRIDAQFEPYNPPKPMPITNVLGMESSETSPGAVKFEVDGKEYRLDAITEKGETHLFMIVSDKTSGKDTYPAGRYLYVDPPDRSGRMIIDFNRAFSPPCAFTKFATCPLPPRQNRLPFAIDAGEKYKRHTE